MDFIEENVVTHSRTTRSKSKLIQNSLEKENFSKNHEKDTFKERKISYGRKDKPKTKKKRVFGNDIKNLLEQNAQKLKPFNKTSDLTLEKPLKKQSLAKLHTEVLSSSTPINKNFFNNKRISNKIDSKDVHHSFDIQTPIHLKGMKLDSPDFTTFVSPVLARHETKKLNSTVQSSHNFITNNEKENTDNTLVEKKTESKTKKSLIKTNVNLKRTSIREVLKLHKEVTSANKDKKPNISFTDEYLNKSLSKSEQCQGDQGSNSSLCLFQTNTPSHKPEEANDEVKKVAKGKNKKKEILNNKNKKEPSKKESKKKVFTKIVVFIFFK